MDNNNRFDLSDYLIHFFRDIDLSSDSSIVMPEHMGWQNISEGEFLPAFFMLRAVLRNGRLGRNVTANQLYMVSIQQYALLRCQ